MAGERVWEENILLATSPAWFVSLLFVCFFVPRNFPSGLGVLAPVRTAFNLFFFLFMAKKKVTKKNRSESQFLFARLSWCYPSVRLSVCTRVIPSVGKDSNGYKGMPNVVQYARTSGFAQSLILYFRLINSIRLCATLFCLFMPLD